MSVKFQITLPESLAFELKAVAARRKMPLAQYIRDTMADRIKAERKPPRGNPFAAFTGIIDTTERDLAARVDEILYK